MTNPTIKHLAALSQPIVWGPVKARFSVEAVDDESLISNISIIPTVGDKYVVMKIDSGLWELIGGTLEPYEHYMHALARELREEIGAELISYHIFGHFHCKSNAALPYRPHIPHPYFIRVVGVGEVKIVSTPLNPPDGEQVIAVELVDYTEAVRRFEDIGRTDLADLYRLAHEMMIRQREEGEHG
ncbi:NUDIX hydrolase [Paenibacillus selenitireducens]|uniref:NUDIX hydrolase n=1 Tax=Paenibacillus selenitireducens TaxID=1324314 RepID=A0A1T2X1M8_9BACL|nr:NUDIX hydrolase [Paenibacillus selenitireducens]OPA73725.1 NUDIX hydrolase [Paenibacillus selenitireducens]